MLMILKILMMIMLMMKFWMLERRLLINEATDDADNAFCKHESGVDRWL